MKRVAAVFLCLMLAAAGFTFGYFARQPAAAPTAPPAPPAAPAAKDASAPPKPPAFEIHDEDTGFNRSPLLEILGSPYIGRYEHGPARVHVEYFVDFVQDGVQKRAFLQAFNLDDYDDTPRNIGLLPDLITDGFFDMAESRGAVIVDKDLALRTALNYDVTGHRPEGQQGLGAAWSSTSWDVFESYQAPGAAEPPPALVLDYSACEKARENAGYYFPLFQVWDPHGGTAFSLGSREFVRKGSYAGHDGAAVFSLNILRMPAKFPATEETAAAEVDKVRKQLAANPDDAGLKTDLAHALNRQRFFLKDKTPEAAYPLAEEAVKLAQEAATRQPGNMLYRADLRTLLFRQAWLMTEGKYAAELPKVLDEIESLVPLYDAEYTGAAALLLQWKNPALDRELPEAEKKRIARDTDARVVTLLRRYAEVWRLRPDVIEKKRQEYQKDAAGKSYADTLEFKGLLDDMRAWAKKDDPAH